MLNKKTKVLYFDLRLWCRVGAQQMFPQKAAWGKKKPCRVRLCSGCAVPRCAGLCLAVPCRAVPCLAVPCCAMQDRGSCTRLGADGSSLSSPAPAPAVVALNLQTPKEQQVLCLMWEGAGNFPDCPLRLCHDALCSTQDVPQLGMLHLLPRAGLSSSCCAGTTTATPGAAVSIPAFVLLAGSI